MRTLRRVGLGLALAGLWAGSAAPMLAADNGTVDAQVTVATPCLALESEFVDFGTLPFSTVNSGAGGVQSIQIQNCGSANEQLFARGTNATANGAPVWTLAQDQPCSVADVNAYMLRAQDGNDLNNVSVALSLTDQVLEQIGAGSVAATDRLALDMPCVGSDGVGEVVSFQAIFTATF